MKSKLLIGAGLLTCAFAALTACAGPIEDLKSDDSATREKAREAILLTAEDQTPEDRIITIKALIELAAEKVEPRIHKSPTTGETELFYPHRDSKHLAIILLGELKAEQAIDVLFENLTYRNPVSNVRWRPFELGDRYPAAGALAKIGKPAVPKAEELLETSSDPLTLKLCSWIISKVSQYEKKDGPPVFPFPEQPARSQSDNP